MKKSDFPKNSLRRLPGIGPSIERDLNALGIFKISDLVGKNPQQLYDDSNRLVGQIQDRCLLYVFRSAVYCAEDGPDPHLRDWWKWKDSSGKANQNKP